MIKDLDAHLKKSIRKHGVPGASVAVLRGHRVVAQAAAGVLNLNTGVKATTDSVFQIGSITKPITATMIMQLRDEGRLELDAPLLDYLPGFRNADMQRLREVTLRHLLTHQSGIDGDYFPEMNWAPDGIARLLEQCANLPSLFAPGSNYSYCNVGFSALGRVIEVLDNRSYDESLKARVFVPLDMNHAMSVPEDNMRFRVACGHVPGKNGPEVPGYSYLSPGHKAAGATPAMTSADLLRFAAAHMNDGVGLNGHKLLPVRSAREMRRRQVALGAHVPDRMGFGLAWIVGEWSGQRVFTHNGGTLGQFSMLAVCPGKRFAVAVLTNGGAAEGVFTDILHGLFAAQAKISAAPILPIDPAIKPVAAELAGVYANLNDAIRVTEKAGTLYMTGAAGGPLDLRFCKPRVARLPQQGYAEFGGRRGEAAPWLRIGGRVFNRRGQ